jgi:hypothetical protein
LNFQLPLLNTGLFQCPPMTVVRFFRLSIMFVLYSQLNDNHYKRSNWIITLRLILAPLLTYVNFIPLASPFKLTSLAECCFPLFIPVLGGTTVVNQDLNDIQYMDEYQLTVLQRLEVYWGQIEADYKRFLNHFPVSAKKQDDFRE